MRNKLTIQEYDNLEDAVFPLIIGSNTKIQSLSVACESCEGKIRNLRVKWCRLNSDCVEIRMGGYCKACGVYETGKSRWYTKQNRFEEFLSDGLSESRLVGKTLIDRLKLLFNRGNP